MNGVLLGSLKPAFKGVYPEQSDNYELVPRVLMKWLLPASRPNSLEEFRGY